VDGNDDTRSGAPSGGRRRILVADDSESYRRIARSQLTARGLDVVAVATGAEALDRLAAEPFDLLLVDGMMPRLDGPATAREIRRREAAAGSPRIPIVAITASGQPEDRHRMLEAGIDDLVVKPLLEDELVKALDRWLPSPGTRRAIVIPAVDAAHAARPRPASAGSVAASNGTVVDEAAFERLAMLGDASFVERMVRLFLADAEGRVSQVEEAAAAGDVARLRVALDALESIASTVGATELGRHAHELGDEMRANDPAPEIAGRPGDSMRLADDLEATRDRLHDLLGAMRAGAR
jgi:CheY-like chemotaxis protein/HPt (histidine-containing phosphotransfer) domain-containing protein